MTGLGTYAYYKGGAYRNTKPAEYAFIRDIRLDGALLYERAFDQGKYDFPLGFLVPGEHILTATFESSGGYPTKLWEHVCEHSFDPDDIKKSWDSVQILYMGNTHTRDYDSWSEGVAFAQGSDVGSGVRPPPIRRGTTFMVAMEDPSFAAGDGDVKVFPLGSATEVSWGAYQTKVEDYTGGYYETGGLSTRQREHWEVAVPALVPVGRYILRGYDASGTEIGTGSVFYVIYDPYLLVDGTKFTKQDIETWAYDEDEDGKTWTGYGPDADHERDDFSAYHWSGNTQTTYASRAMRRDPSFASPVSVLDLAIAAADGTSDQFESMRRLYRLTNQRINWSSPTWTPDAEAILIRIGEGLTISDAETYSLPNNALPSAKVIQGQCMDFGNVLAALARSIGIPARPASGQSGIFGWNFHVFTEVYLPDSL
ncbi:MAG: transglutaminase domain-containing protein, partial [Phycisphaerae bacterium]|nr:transglutaminase domain-containing protein [Phycisphaerae bacterium]